MKYSLPKEIKIGGTIQYKKSQIDLSIPKEDFKGIAYAYDFLNEKTTTDLLEFGILNLAKEIGIENTKIHLLDFSITRKYQHINKFRNEKWFVNYVTSKTIANALESLEATVIDRNNNYLLGDYEDICEYNLENSDEPLEYNLIILNLDYFEVSNQTIYDSLIKLMKFGKNAGVLFFVQMNSTNFANEIKKAETENHSFNNKRLELLQFIRTGLSVFYEYNSKFQIQNTNTKIVKSLQEFDYNPNHILLNETVSVIEDLIKQHKKENENSGADFVSVPIGKKGRKIFNFSLGSSSNANHCFIGGQTGMGKSNLLNNIIVQIAENYSSDEVRLQLMDLKGSGGTEFQFYDKHPNVEKLVLTSNLDKAISVIQKFVDEIYERNTSFKAIKAKNIFDYRKKSGIELPNKILIIDEIQKLFQRNYTNKFNKLLDEITREGRGFGMHIIIATQTLQDVNLQKSIMEQTPLRISFRVASQGACNKIMDYSNDAPRKIKPYEIVYNTNNGLKEDNIIFKTIEIKTDTIEKRLAKSNFETILPFKMEIIDNSSIFSDLESKKTKTLEITKSSFGEMNNENEIDLDNYE